MGAQGERADEREQLMRPLVEVPSAFQAFDRIASGLGDAAPAVFLDYDGTLTPVVDRPELAVLSDSGRRTIQRVASRLPTCVVSGRDRRDVEKLVGVDSIIYAGSHGFDIRIPGHGDVELEGMQDFGALLDRAEALLQARLGTVDGAIVERKKFSIACHYRLVADADLAVFHDAVEDTLRRVPGLKKKGGKKIEELQPDIDWDKGKAVLHLLGALRLDDARHMPLFLGDDLTDEDAFRALRRNAHGIGIVVADVEQDPERPTLAHYRLRDPEEVLRFLERMLEAMPRPGG